MSSRNQLSLFIAKHIERRLELAVAANDLALSPLCRDPKRSVSIMLDLSHSQALISRFLSSVSLSVYSEDGFLVCFCLPASSASLSFSFSTTWRLPPESAY
jgi:hypothetical protein